MYSFVWVWQSFCLSRLSYNFRVQKSLIHSIFHVNGNIFLIYYVTAEKKSFLINSLAKYFLLCKTLLCSCWLTFCLVVIFALFNYYPIWKTDFTYHLCLSSIFLIPFPSFALHISFCLSSLLPKIISFLYFSDFFLILFFSTCTFCYFAFRTSINPWAFTLSPSAG